MRNLKRALSLALASVMLLGMMVVGTSAASYPDVDDKDHVEAIEVLSAVGVIVGDNGNFRPDDKVSRNEMAVIMAKLILGTYEADSYVGSHPFTDVPAWADRYVAACYNSGIIAGRGEGIYDGSATVTAVEAAAMMLRALGYEDLSANATGSWDQPVAAKANEVALFDGLSGSSQTPMDRNSVAKLALNTLKANVVTTIKGTDINIPGSVTIIGSRTYEPVPRGDANTESDNYAGNGAGNAGMGYQQLCEKLYGKDLKLVSGQNDDLQRPASTWRYKNDDVITIADEADYTFVLDDDYTTKTNTQAVVQALTDKDDLVADAAATYKLNGANSTTTDVKNAATYGTVIEVYLKSGDSKKFDKVVAYYYTLNKITDVDTNVSDSDAKKGVSAYVDFDNAGTFNNDKIANYNADTYEKDTYVAVIVKGSEIIDSFIPEVEETSVSTVKANSYITAGSTRYYPTADYDNAVVTISLSSASNVSTKSDDSYAIYLDKNGYMLGLEAIEASAASLDDVYFVDSIYEGAPTTAAGGAKTPHYAQLVALADGTVSQVELEKQDKATATTATIGTNDSYYYNRANYMGKLVTISDKEWTANNNTSGNANDDVKYKKNNNKFDLELWDHTANDDYDVYTEVKFTENDELKTDSTRVAINAKKNDNGVDTVAAAKPIRLNSSTKYVFAEDSGEDLDVKTATGGVAYKFNVANLLGSGSYASYDKAIVVTEADKAYALYMVIPCADSKLSNTFSEDVIYIHDNAKDEGEGFFITEVYLADGTKVARDDKDAWKFDDSVTLSNDKFYTYATNEDGYIEVNDADLLDVSSAYVWEDETGAVATATVAAGDYEDGQKLLTITKSNKVEDIKVDGAKFVDLHDKDDEYENAINSLSRLMDLLENGKVSSATISMNVSKDGAKTIFLVTAPGCSHSWGSDSVITAATCTAEGSKRQTCATCGATRTVAIPATGHTVSSYTPTASGHSGTCSVCGATITNEAHTYEWVPGSGSLSTTDTTKHVKVCSVCDYEDTTTAANHTPAGAFTSVNDTNHKQACSACGADVTGAHRFGAWDPAKPEDCTQAYDHTHTCSDCNHSVTESVSAGTHTGASGQMCSVCGKTIP